MPIFYPFLAAVYYVRFMWSFWKFSLTLRILSIMNILFKYKLTVIHLYMAILFLLIVYNIYDLIW